MTGRRSSDKRPWWRLERYSEELAPNIHRMFSHSGRYHQHRLQTAAAAMWAYERDIYEFGSYPSGLSSAFPWAGEDWFRKSPKSNEIKKTVDAATAWLFADQPRIEVRANGAPFEMRRVLEERSLALDQTVDSVPSRINFMDLGRDGWLTGFAAHRPVHYEGRIEYRRLQAHQLWWDPVDAADGKPWMMACIERWDREALMAWYRDIDREYIDISRDKHKVKVEALDQLASVGGDWFYGADAYMPPYEWHLREQGVWSDASDQVLVVHLWRRSTTSEDGKADGRYVMLASGAKGRDGRVLIDAKYGRRDLPIVWWSPYPAPSGGITGLGLAHILMGHQRAMDLSNYRVQQHLDELGVSKLLIDTAAGMGDKEVEAMAQKHGIAVLKVPGMNVPQIYTPDAFRRDHFDWTEILRRRVQEDSGLGQVIVNGATQLGANASGVAQVEEEQRQTDRVSDVYERWSAMRLATGERTIEVIEDAIATDKDFAATFMDRDGSWKRMPWSKLHRLNEQYQVTLEPTGALGRSRAGRLQKAMELINLGVIPPEIGKRMMMDSPDIRAMSRASGLSAEDRVTKMLAELSSDDGDHAQAVDEDLDFNVALLFVNAAINEAHNAGAKQETIGRLRNFKLAVAKRLEDEAQKQAAAMAPPAIPGLPPGGMPVV
jgi:hypothetical protein